MTSIKKPKAWQTGQVNDWSSRGAIAPKEIAKPHLHLAEKRYLKHRGFCWVLSLNVIKKQQMNITCKEVLCCILDVKHILYT